MEVSTSIAMKIASPNDVDPDCIAEAGKTYGVANRYASSTGEGGKVVDTFNGNEGEKDELNTNTSCAKLSMEPNNFDSTYSDVTVFTNSPSGYALTVQSAENTSPNLVNVSDNTQYIEAGTLTENNGTVTGGQNKWAYKTNNGIITDWTAMSTTPAPIKAYDNYTEGGDTTRVTYGISTGNNPTGTYTTELTYTATMFDGLNPYIDIVDANATANLTISPMSFNLAKGDTKTMTVTPAEGYFLDTVSCPEGHTCTGYHANPISGNSSDIATTGPHTIAIRNDSVESGISTIAFAVKHLDGSLQTFSASAHSGDPQDTIYNLKDARDNKIYRVAKLKDDKWWMVQDLRLGGDDNVVLTSQDSNISNNFTLLRENTDAWCETSSAACDNQSLMLKDGVPNGYLYNWYAATAGTGLYGAANASESICPKNWRLPDTVGSSTTAGYYYLTKQYGWGEVGTEQEENIKKMLAQPTPGFNATALRAGNTINKDNQLMNTYYWTGKTYGNDMAYMFYAGYSYYLLPSYWTFKYHGLAIRCTAAS